METLLFCIGVFIASISQIILKKSASIHHKNRIREYLNMYVVVAYGLVLVSNILIIHAYKVISLSMGPILESLGYIFVAILSVVVLRDKIYKNQIIGLIMILIGVCISNIGGV